MDKGQRAKLLKGLDHVRQRPGMYFSSEVPAVVNFIEGFRLACALLGSVANYDAIYKQVIEERGWKWSSQPIWTQMKERGLNDDAIIAELFDIQMMLWQRIPNPQPLSIDNHS